MNAVRKQSFEARPEYLKANFLEHIAAMGRPRDWQYITHAPPPDGDVEVLLEGFVLPRESVRLHGLAACPICSPESPKYMKGHLLWSRVDGGLYAVGHCCGHHYFQDGLLRQALRRHSSSERRKDDERLLEHNWMIPQAIVRAWDGMQPQVRALDAVTNALRAGMSAGLCRSIHRMVKDTGYLLVSEKVDRKEEMRGALRSIEVPFGDRPLAGASLLRGGSRPMAQEGKIGGLVAAIDAVAWASQDDAIWWMCEQPDGELRRLVSIVEEVLDCMRAALADLEALRAFLDPDNVEIITAWSRQAHGRGQRIQLFNEEGVISIWRGGKRQKKFRLPASILQDAGVVPSLERP
ncbi:hypothetical protein [Ensifer sp. BR816]|uniref:hypothetical protein n=1 Tax=Rhizobium sp. (strain BR816) TaxID=1057002 RepID=UPI00036424C5|nr:hypothetical protein [Ensifer sp. BR816]